MSALEREDSVLNIGDAEVAVLHLRKHDERSVVSAVGTVEKKVVYELIKDVVEDIVDIVALE